MSDVPEMVERLARAIAGVPTGYLDERWIRKARDGLAAMREPTEAMIVDGFEAMKGDWQMCREAAEDAGRCWRAMIDEALKTASA